MDIEQYKLQKNLQIESKRKYNYSCNSEDTIARI